MGEFFGGEEEEDHFTGFLLRSDHLSWNYSTERGWLHNPLILIGRS
jgi:hypothetical protein